jgi:hypothetical protein
VAARRREQRAISGAKPRPRDLAAQNLELVAQDQQLDVLHVQATATPNERPKQSPEPEVEEGEGHCRRSSQPSARTGRDTSNGALQGRDRTIGTLHRAEASRTIDALKRRSPEPVADRRREIRAVQDDMARGHGDSARIVQGVETSGYGSNATWKGGRS